MTSRTAVTVAAVSTVAGLLSGLAMYLGRSPEREQHVAGTEAWLPHVAVAVVLAVWLLIASRRSPLGLRVILAPLGRPIAARIAATFRARAVLRWPAVGFLVFVEAYLCWRIGVQVFAGLDPNFTANAWGGPSYAGAMLCHYLDGALLLLVCHTLLRWVTLPSIDRQHQHAQ
ncbi:hypothetical protein SAMN05443668_11018 [Cryptosporangium aurantiacum]|uniref:Uncharacterized protein n=2 Tax=Cryptosporangium aurantiacum TaxID=134849 RepID=A0A1M7RCJ8_9ACTN|nr:hypothetical protein SAMN05443668_11018 [Cryptosporangium aurantiacum]